MQQSTARFDGLNSGGRDLVADFEAELARSDALPRYLETLGLIERLHRLMLDCVKDEFERLGRDDLTSVQALLLFHIGDEELSAGDLRARGYYQGSNVSYNVKKLVELGFLNHERDPEDRRAVRIRATASGRIVQGLVGALFERQAARIEADETVAAAAGAATIETLRSLERFWRAQIRYIY